MLGRTLSYAILSVLLTTATTAMASCNSTWYFGYGSNLWRDQMTRRCNASEYLGIARLTGYRWIIYSRGYANVVEIPDEKTEDVVWGLVYCLQPDDETQLDLNEGVPESYTKENITVDFWPAHNGSPPNTTTPPTETKMLVYIDRNRTEPGEPKKEYIYRMNQGIRDAVKESMPISYVEKVLRKFIPDDEDEKVAAFARHQAVLFIDEN